MLSWESVSKKKAHWHKNMGAPILEFFFFMAATIFYKPGMTLHPREVWAFKMTSAWGICVLQLQQWKPSKSKMF